MSLSEGGSRTSGAPVADAAELPADAAGLPADAAGLPADAAGLPADAAGLPADAAGLPAGAADDLDARRLAFIRAGEDAREDFSPLALSCLERQLAAIPMLGELARRRTGCESEISSWRDFPPVPSLLLRRAELHERPSAVRRRFRSSGTSRGAARRVVTAFDDHDLACMDAAIDASARRYLFPDVGDSTMELFVMAPPPEAAPEMIMVYGMARLGRVFCGDRVTWFVGSKGLDLDALMSRLAEAASEGVPVTLAGASFAFVHLLDRLASSGRRLALPEGSRLLHAGGFKGRSRTVDPDELKEAFASHLGLPGHHCVNLLGLTEHASQWYDDDLAAWHEGRPLRPGKQAPPWCRSRVLDGRDLAVVAPGEEGRLCHLDLANGHHPLMVLSEDWARSVPQRSDDAFHLLGRDGASPEAGCSLKADEWSDPEGRA